MPQGTPNGSRPLPGERILLHACCAPCSAVIIEKLQSEEFNVRVLFYNPNIHPAEEYERRKDEQRRLTLRMKVEFVELTYDPEAWHDRIRGLEQEPERGRRCEQCFHIRLGRAAQYAHENNFKVFTSTLGISRWKDFEQVNRCGLKAAARYPGLIYWMRNWRKQGGSQRMVQLAKEQNLYRQNYCGCIYSKRNQTLTPASEKI